MKTERIMSAVRFTLCLTMLLAFGCASFEITSMPTADIYENGAKIGTTPYSFSLMSGERRFTLKRAGYVDEEVVVSSLDDPELHYRMRWVGRTRIDTLPRGARVTKAISGELLGTAPFGYRLAEPEDVRIELDGFEPVEIEIEPNETYLIELKPKGGFKSVFYKQILFVSDSGPVEIFDRMAGERVGVTPVELDIEAGTELEYRSAGCRTQVALISKNAPRRIRISLEPLTKVTLVGPEGAGVYRPGGTRQLGKLPFTIEVDRDVMYEVRKQGYYDSSLVLTPGMPSEINVNMKKIPYKTIETTPPGAEVYRLGGLEKLGTTPYRTMVDNERVFEIKKPGFHPKVIGVGPGSPVSLDVPLVPARDDPDAAAISTLDSPVVDSF